MKKRGKIIAIEGTDGAGKGTQVAALLERAAIERIPCTSFEFPRYHTPTGKGVKHYLQGHFGEASKLPPKLSAGYYAIDRFAASPEIEAVLEEGINAIMNRYLASNWAHQAAKLPQEARREFVEWDKKYEYEILKIPRPDLTACLYVPREVSTIAIEKRGLEKDGHETDLSYQEEVVKTYLWLAKTEPDWKLIDCMKGNVRKTPEEVNGELWSVIKPVLLA